MGRTVKDPNRRQPKPVQKVQLSEKNVGRRIVLVVLFLAIGSGFLVYGFMNFLRGDSGWREISVKAGSELNCSEDFTLKYNVGAGGVSAGKGTLADLYRCGGEGLPAFQYRREFR